MNHTLIQTIRGIVVAFFCACIFGNIGLAQGTKKVELPSTDSLSTWMKALHVPALGLVTIEDGKLSQNFVLGEQKEGLPASKQTLFDVASLTKSMTTMLCLTLASQGKWDLDEPLFHYWTDPDVKDDPRHKKLTSRIALSHRTGFKNWRYMYEDKKLAFDFAPGEKVQYSGEGFEYVRRAITKKFGLDFEGMIDSLVFGPLGMKNSHLTWREGVDSMNFAYGYDGQGKLYAYEKVLKASASDDLLITTSDIGRFMQAVLEKRDLSEELFQQMIQPRSEIRPKVAFGLSWVVFSELSGGEYALFNAGGDKGVSALMVLLPESDRAIAILTNGDNGRQLVMKILAASLDVGPEMLGRL